MHSITVGGIPPVEGTDKTAGSRDIEVELVRDCADDPLEVEHMFDGDHRETFDPTLAVEVSDGMELIRLRVGDVLNVRIHINT